MIKIKRFQDVTEKSNNGNKISKGSSQWYEEDFLDVMNSALSENQFINVMSPAKFF